MLTEQDRKQLKQQISGNRHEVFVISVEEMDAIVRSSPRCNRPGIKDSWRMIKDKVALGF